MEPAGMAGSSCNLVSTGARKVGFLITVELLIKYQCLVQRLHRLSSLVVDGVSCLDAHREVLEQGVAAYQAPQPGQVLFTWWWNKEMKRSN